MADDTSAKIWSELSSVGAGNTFLVSCLLAAISKKTPHAFLSSVQMPALQMQMNIKQ